MRFWAFVIAAYYGWEQNEYFGWHWFPHSDAELIADGITAMLVILIIMIAIYERSNDGERK